MMREEERVGYRRRMTGIQATGGVSSGVST